MNDYNGTYYFDENAAEKACEFFVELRHIKGAYANQPFILEPWQRTIVRDIFGWKRASDGTRRFRTAYIEIPRKNGKSTLCAGIALYLLFLDGEEGAEVYSVAGDREQALMVFDPACAMIRKCGMLEKRSIIRKSSKRVIVVETNSFYRAVAANVEGSHGYGASGIIFDELHVQPNRDLWDVMRTSTGGRTQPLTVAITTAGYDRSSICWEQHQYAQRILDANDDFDDPEYYAVVFAADLEDDWRDEAVWHKANPNLGVSISLDYLRGECHKAQESPSYENTFRRLHLNQWTEQDVRWMPMVSWDACRRKFNEAELLGQRCWAGLDLASTRDVNALSLVFPLDDGRYRILCYYWIPDESKDARGEQDRRQLLNWVSNGHVRTTDGNVTDYETIVDDFLKLCERFDVQELAFDPHGPAAAFVQALENKGFDHEKLVSFRQGMLSMGAPTKELERLVVGEKLEHNGDPVLRWMAGNVVVKQDEAGNIKPNKGRSGDKIDGIVACIMGIGRAMESRDTGKSVYETRGLLSV